jgi:hypothetical protein
MMGKLHFSVFINGQQGAGMVLGVLDQLEQGSVLEFGEIRFHDLRWY